MNVKSAEKKENSTVELVIEVAAEEFDAAVEKAYRKNKGSISVPGFRKGKAPRKIIESMYGASVFYEDAIDEVYPTAYADAVKEQGLDVVAYPSVEVVSVGKEGLTFKATVTVKPEVKLGEYKGLTAPKAEVTISEQDLERELAPLVERATRLVSVDREAKLGDTVVLDFDGFKDGQRFEGGQGTNYDLELGSHTFVPGFEDALVGVKAGDEKDIDITFPKEYPAELANQPAVFKVKVHEIKEKLAPTLDDEFAKDVSEFETLDALKKDLEDKLRQRRQDDAQRDFANALMEQVCDNLEVQLPEAMVDYRVDEMVRDFAQRISNQGIPFEDYMKYIGTDLNTLKAQMRPNAIANLKAGLALDAIAAAESLPVTDEDIQEEQKKLAEQYHMELDQVKEIVPQEDLKQDILRSKAEKLVIDSGKVGEAPKKDEKIAEEKPAKKPAAKKTTAKKAETGEEKPAKKASSAEKKSTKKEETDGEEKPAKKPAAKKTTAKKAETDEEKPAPKKTTRTTKTAKKTEE
jgi:trigger factor